jgi:hypothetical protein
MTLPSSAPITLQQIQSEYGVSGLVNASTAAGLNPLPTAMLDFLGLTNYVFSVNVPPISLYNNFSNNGETGFITQSFGQIFFGDNGVLSYVSGDNSVNYPITQLTDSWIDSVPNGGNRASVAANYDFEWEFVSGDTTNGSFTYAGGDVVVDYTHQISPAFGTRVNLGSNAPILVRMIEFNNYGGNVFGPQDSEIYLRSKIYSAGTNNLISNVLHHVKLTLRQGSES